MSWIGNEEGGSGEHVQPGGDVKNLVGGVEGEREEGMMRGSSREAGRVYVWVWVGMRAS